MLPAGPCQTHPLGKQFPGPNWPKAVIIHPAPPPPAAADEEATSGGVVTGATGGGGGGGGDVDTGGATAGADEEGGDVGLGLLTLAATLLEAAEGCAVGTAPVPFPAPAPAPAGAVPSDGVGAHVAESPTVKLFNPSGCNASAFPAGRVPT